MARKASPHEAGAWPPPEASSTMPNTSGPKEEPMKPRQACTAMVAPRWPGGATATTPAVIEAESPVTVAP